MKFQNGRFSGKAQTAIGKMTAYTLNGLNVFRSIPEKVKVDQSQGAVNRRARFGVLSDLVKSLSQIFALRTFTTTPGQNFRNPAMTANNDAVTVDGAGLVTVDYSALTLSKGSLYAEPKDLSYDSGTQIVLVEWTPSSNVGTLPTDKIFVAVLAEGSDEVLMALEEDARSSGSVSTGVSAIPNGTVCRVYSFTRSTNGNIYSDSQYLGSFTKA